MKRISVFAAACAVLLAGRAAAAPPAGKVTVQRVQSPSVLASEATRKALRQHERELLDCYAQEMTGAHEPTATVTLGWTLRTTGAIQAAKAEFSGARSDDASFAFLSCVKGLLAGWNLGKIDASAPVEVELRFSGAAGPRPADAAAREGAIDKEALRKILNANFDQIRGCYEQELALDHGLDGKVTLRWVVREDGSVARVEVDETGTTLRNRKVEQCMMARVAGWKFPRPRGGATATIVNPWTFSSQVQTVE